MRLLIACGLVAPILRLGLILTLGALHPTYSQTTDFISELGAPDSPYAGLMNYVGIALVGVLLAAFSIPLRRYATDPLARVAAWLLFVSGISFVVVGLAPCDRAGCEPGGSTSVMLVHIVSGFVGMTTQAVAPVAYGLRVFGSDRGGLRSGTSLLLGVISVAGLIALATGFGPHGLAQKTMQFAADVWVFTSAVYLYRRRNPASGAMDQREADRRKAIFSTR